MNEEHKISRAALLAAIAALAWSVLAAGLAGCGAQGYTPSGDAGPSARGGLSGEPGPSADELAGVVVGDARFPLSSWDAFGEYWVEVADGDGGYAYEEVGADGGARRYRLSDGAIPGPGIGGQLAVRSSLQVGADEDRDFVTVDCSTGEVAYWKFGEDFLESARAVSGDGGMGDGELLSALGLERGDGDDVIYANPPVRTRGAGQDDGDGADARTFTDDELLGRLGDGDGDTGGLDGWPTKDEMIFILKTHFEEMDEEERRDLVNNGGDEMVAALVEKYGEDVVYAYKQEN